MSAAPLTGSFSQNLRLVSLPYDILHKILCLVLPKLPEKIALTLDRPGPPWLDMFTMHLPIIACPPILLVCRLLTRHCLRMIYTDTRLSIHAGRSYLARLSRLRAKRYVQKLDLALERQLYPNSKQKHEALQRHHTSSLDTVSFYSPAYLVDLLHRIFPRLRTIHLTIVETGGPDSGSDRKPLNLTGRDTRIDPEPVHYFALAAFTQSGNIDPATWNDLITAIRYKRSSRPDTSLATKSPFLFRSRQSLAEPKGTANSSEEALNTTFLPNLSKVELYLTTCRSYVDNEKSKDGSHWTEQLQLVRHLRAVQRTIDLSRKSVELKLFRTIIHGGPGMRKEMDSRPLEQHLVDALMRELGEARSKGKERLIEDEVDETWQLM